MPSRGSGLGQAVARTTLSPMRTMQEPCACFASFPVSKWMDLPPCSSTVTSCFIYFPFGMLPVIVQARRSLEGPDSCNSATTIVTRVHVPGAAGWGGWNSGQPRVAETEAADALSRPPCLENMFLPEIDHYLGEPGPRHTGACRDDSTHNTPVKRYFSGWQAAYLRIPSL